MEQGNGFGQLPFESYQNQACPFLKETHLDNPPVNSGTISISLPRWSFAFSIRSVANMDTTAAQTLSSATYRPGQWRLQVSSSAVTLRETITLPSKTKHLERDSSCEVSRGCHMSLRIEKKRVREEFFIMGNSPELWSSISQGRHIADDAVPQIDKYKCTCDTDPNQRCTVWDGGGLPAGMYISSYTSLVVVMCGSPVTIFVQSSAAYREAN